MKTLIIAMGILSLFASCSGRKEKVAKNEDSTLNGGKVEKDRSCLDTIIRWLIWAVPA